MTDIITNYGDTISKRDWSRLVELLAEDVRLKVPNAGWICGRENVLNFYREFFDARKITHLELETHFENKGRLYAHFQMLVASGDGTPESEKMIDVLSLSGKGLIQEIHCYMNHLAGGPAVEAAFSKKPLTLPPGLPDGLNINHYTAAKKIIKKWGYELWLVHESMRLAYKIIFIKAGNRTSLQYHERKEEANFLLSGRAVLHYQHRDKEDICQTELSPGAVVHITPKTIHRIEALTDILLIESSTAELDDVIRVSDDWNRPDGRIDSEHAA